MKTRDKLAGAIAASGKRQLSAVSRRSGISFNGIWRAIRGKDTITLRTVSRIALALDLDAAELFGDDWDYASGRAAAKKQH